MPIYKLPPAPREGVRRLFIFNKAQALKKKILVKFEEAESYKKRALWAFLDGICTAIIYLTA